MQNYCFAMDCTNFSTKKWQNFGKISLNLFKNCTLKAFCAVFAHNKCLHHYL